MKYALIVLVVSVGGLLGEYVATAVFGKTSTQSIYFNTFWTSIWASIMTIVLVKL